MRRRMAILLLALMPLTLGSCSTEGIEPPEPVTECSAIVDLGVMECRFPLSDGRHVTCVLYDGMREAAMSCDWAHVEGADSL